MSTAGAWASLRVACIAGALLTCWLSPWPSLYAAGAVRLRGFEREEIGRGNDTTGKKGNSLIITGRCC